MKISIVGAGTDLGRLVVDRLEGLHELHLYSAGPLARADGHAAEGVEELDLREEDDAERCCRGVSAVVHLAPFARLSAAGDGAPAPGRREVADADAVDYLDAIARGTYNLFDATREAGVDRVVLASSLALFDRYDPDYIVDEWWKPLPGTDPVTLGVYCAEEVARQYCLHGGIRCVALRFLPLGEDAERETHPDDAVAAVMRALELRFTVPGYRWRVFHVATGARFGTTQAREILGWEAHHG
ncbi:MAG: NAD-dependent epimerase/dehydratase family protein [Spirochaetota bacterium]